jgi:hypothetical protein
MNFLVLFSFLLIASAGYASDQTSLMSNEPANQGVYQKTLDAHNVDEINYLMNLMTHSSFSFERNGQRAGGKDAVKLLKYKLNQNKNIIHTAEDFIDVAASFSAHTKQSYYVIFPDGKRVALKDLLYRELNKLRSQSQPEPKTLLP